MRTHRQPLQNQGCIQVPKSSILLMHKQYLIRNLLVVILIMSAPDLLYALLILFSHCLTCTVRQKDSVECKPFILIGFNRLMEKQIYASRYVTCKLILFQYFSCPFLQIPSTYYKVHDQ